MESLIPSLQATFDVVAPGLREAAATATTAAAAAATATATKAGAVSAVECPEMDTVPAGEPPPFADEPFAQLIPV